MEEVDNIILNSLKECGCDFAEDVSSLSEFSTENVVEAAVRCLRIINPELKMSHSLPPGMSARFRVGTALAQACQSAGYRGDIGYQTFLYSSEADIRRLFMFLVEKLPRKKDEATIEQPSSGGSVLHRNIARVLKSQLSSIWLPSYCKKNSVRWSQNEFSIEGARGTMPFHTDSVLLPQGVGTKKNPPSKDLLKYYREKLPFVDDQLSHHRHLSPSMMERNILELSIQQEWENQINSGKMGSRTSPEERRKQNIAKLEMQIRANERLLADVNDEMSIGGISLGSSFKDVASLIASKSSALDTTVSVDLTTDESVNLSQIGKPNELMKNNKVIGKDLVNEDSETGAKVIENHVQDQNGAEIEEDVPQETEEEMIKRTEKELKTELKETVEKMERMDLEVHNFQETIIKAKEELAACEESNKTMQEKVKLQKKTLQLLPDAEENIAKLEELIQANKKKMISLTQQWEKHRVPLQQRFDELKKELSQKETQSERKLKEVKLVRQRIKEGTEEMKRKEQLEKELTGQFGDMTKDISRKSYTKRIFEIVANIRKQKEEIERVLIDMRSLQKEINQLEGRVDRTFTAADDLFFMDAGTDESVRQAYKYLASLNLNCSLLLKTVDQTGEVMREIRDLEEQVATESKKNTAANLEKITGDFKEMKKENSDMMKKLKSMTTASPKPRKKKT